MLLYLEKNISTEIISLLLKEACVWELRNIARVFKVDFKNLAIWKSNGKNKNIVLVLWAIQIFLVL